MNKIGKSVFCSLLLMSLASCEFSLRDFKLPFFNHKDESILTVKEDVAVPAFEIVINDVKVTSASLASYPVYEASVTTTNTYGNDSTTIYIGYKLLDIIEVANLKDLSGTITATADDGYETYWDDFTSNNNMVAFNKNGSDFKTYPWFCPCDSKTTGDYLKNCKTITIGEKKEEKESASESQTVSQSESSSEVQLAEPTKDKKNNVTFNPYSFKVNGEDITNDDLDGLDKYKVSVEVVNSKGVVSQHTYTGYVLSDVLARLGITTTDMVIVSSDLYESTLSKELVEDPLTILAIECDKATGEDGTIWIAVCSSHNSKSYSKLVVEIKNAN